MYGFCMFLNIVTSFLSWLSPPIFFHPIFYFDQNYIKFFGFPVKKTNRAICAAVCIMRGDIGNGLPRFQLYILRGELIFVVAHPLFVGEIFIICFS